MTVATKRFTIEEYHRLIDLGVFKETDRLELIKGQLIEMSPKGTMHTVACSVLYRELATLLGGIAALRCQDPITLTNSEPEPDLLVARGQEADYLHHHPYPADIILVIEVADSTLMFDQTTKLDLYAEANINNYWIVNLKDRQLECYRQPYQKPSGESGYLNQQIYLAGQSVDFPDLPEIRLELNRVFPN